MSITAPFVTAIVLAAGGSNRLGQPKQVLPFRGATLLDATLQMVRDCGFDQLLVALGGNVEVIRTTVDLAGTEVVENREYATGCSSSLRTAMARVDPRADGVVLLLGDQPGVRADTVRELIGTAGSAEIGVCRYRDGLGHPFWFGRSRFADLTRLHGDKAIWKLLHSGRFDVTELGVDHSIPLDVDTWTDYEALLRTDTTSSSTAARG